METKNSIFEEYKAAYWRSDRKEKGAILDAVCRVAKMTRKAAIRKFRTIQRKDPTHEDGRGQKIVYGADVDAALKTVWEAGNRVCGELLHPSVGEYVDILMRDLDVGGITTRKRPRSFGLMSVATMKQRISGLLLILP